MLGKPKKSLGQNFLTDGRVRRRMIAACGFTRDDTVLEIGAGKGAMTPLIAAEAGKVFAVEIDRSLIPGLQLSLAHLSNVSVIHADFLSFEISGLGCGLKVFGNIPYYITSPIIERLISERARITTAFLTVQKEFARRMQAACGSKEYGSFSCFVQYFARPKVMFDISRNSFTPAPKVDSSFVRLDMLAEPSVRVSDETRFFSIIRSAFGQRRKTLVNSLAEQVSRPALAEFFRRNGLDPRVRPEELSLRHFADLSRS